MKFLDALFTRAADRNRIADHACRAEAIDKVQAVIEFTLDGHVITANDKFLKLTGYGLDEIKGQHHRMFVDDEMKTSPEYLAFWTKLGRGEFDAGQYRRVGKGGRPIWLQASYNPIKDLSGKPYKVVKFATDISDNKRKDAEFASSLFAIDRSQAVIEFSMDGRILNANDNFLAALGYSLDEIRGQHHSMFVTPDERASIDYRLFWEKLGTGAFDSGQYRRIAKGGREVWIQATYNPIHGPDGKPFKVVKFASDITESKIRAADYEGQLNAIGKAQAVIEFTLSGKILSANDNFLKAVGYTLEEVRGQHHAMFVTQEQKNSIDYRLFWEKLGRGEFDAGQYKRVAKGGREIWLQATYNPIYGPDGKPFKVVKYASDITDARLRAADQQGQLDAIAKSQAVIEFNTSGKILHANDNFLKAVGYTLDEVRGQHHSMFVTPEEKDSEAYRLFWDKLARGEYDAGQYRRIGKGGREVWIQASYNPILDPSGRPYKVVKYASDVTQAKLQAADFHGQIAAIGKAQAVIEFSIDGKILNANDNFCAAVGYRLDEIKGQHHAMFVTPEERNSAEYAAFWTKLGRGEFDAGQYKRIGKGGKEIWIQASYNPILDPSGRPFKVVKYATDITDAKLKAADYAGQLNAIGKAQAVIEFSLDGKILNANDNFCAALGYRADEIVGRHHSMFVEPLTRASAEYANFWAKLGRGEYDAGQYKRLAKDGREIWIQASYNPILDPSGKPFKVVKYATDITSAKLQAADYEGQLKAISKAQAVIEFTLDGKVVHANDNFCNALGYRLDEIVGQHHSLFVDAATRNGPEYSQFWTKLGRGEFDGGIYKRIAKGGREIWIQATYNPIIGPDGKPLKVVKYATDITEAKLRAAIYESQLDAISKTQAVIKFTLDGKIVDANQNFLDATGYALDEIVGKHHAMFVDPAHRVTAEYKQFWEKLGRGEADTGQFRRFGKDGREIWLNASYNPILDAAGRPQQIIKYATDITAQKVKDTDAAGQMAAVYRARCAIQLALDGTILLANDNFCRATGYTAEDLVGRHHDMLLEQTPTALAEGRELVARINRGDSPNGQYKRIGRDGKVVWFQANYNSILDLAGKPCKAAIFATDVTDQVNAQLALNRAVEQTQAVAMAAREGDLTQRVPLDDKSGQIRELCGGVNALVENMASVVTRIKDSTEAINTAAREIASGNSDLSARTEQQAASLEETASSMEELTSTVKQNAENARQANQLALGASDVALRGGKVVGEVVGTMSDIQASSKKIVDIISVIDGIAFQTNILALNAAVEAARAGEQGRGFAVVAAEVRSLAQRSAGAAKEIKSLIGDSVEKVGNGTRLVENAGRTMEEIVTSVKRVTDIMAEISAASQEQSQGIEQVNQTITQMDEVTQQNAALVEEASAAARSLESQAEGLSASVAGFRVNAGDNSPMLGARTPALPPAAVAGVRPVSRPKPPVRRAASPAAALPAAVKVASGSGEQWTEF
ncbi:methyl-accepting chemotaxis protein [Nevskia sp.]|uniref:methyl-accepting chemotaxis protein n=1 Tax=Nevskia sp. TaxID=1929292 RepID=UPI0025E17F4C|nr:methyl-accepting chemotaxis protein [Nevskia sp.]